MDGHTGWAASFSLAGVVDIRTVTADRIADAAEVFTSNSTTNQCWCMWFIIPVKEYHAAGAAGNGRSFIELAEVSSTPEW